MKRYLKLGLFFLLASSLALANDTGLFWAQASFATASTFDIASSWGGRELNPIVGIGTFGMRQAVISASMAGGIVLASHLIAKRWPASRRVLKWSLIGGALVHGYASSRPIQSRLQ